MISNKTFLKIFALFAIITCPFMVMYFGLLHGLMYGLLLGSVAALIAGLRVAQLWEDVYTLFLRRCKKRRKSC